MNLEEYITHHSGGKPITYGQYARYIEGWHNSSKLCDSADSLDYKDWVLKYAGKGYTKDYLRECFKKATILSLLYTPDVEIEADRQVVRKYARTSNT